MTRLGASLAIAAIVALAAPAKVASAQLRTPVANDDGIYGRFAYDSTVSIGAMGGVSFGDPVADRRAGAPVGLASIELRARLLDTGGLVVAPEWRPDGTSRLFAGIEMRPGFLLRLLYGVSTNERYGDLLLDSIGFELGMSTLLVEGRVGLAVALGFGVEIPIWVPVDLGGAVALRLGARWTSSPTHALVGPAASVDDWSVLGGVLVRFHGDLGIASWDPPRYELR